MKKNTIKTLVLLAFILSSFTQVNAKLERDVADEITMKVWTTDQNYELTKEDRISNLAWTKQEPEYELIAQLEYTINAFAADFIEQLFEK